MKLAHSNVLLIDEGNTFVKWALFDKKAQMISGIEKAITSRFLKTIQRTYPNLNTIFYSSVRKEGIAQLSDINNWKLFPLSPKSKLPFQSLYKTPKTLGADRKALVSAACSFYPKNNVLIIGTGTCITYDFKDKNNVYHGGAISPGLQMRLDAMAHFTAKLPALIAKDEDSTIGDSTNSAIFKGALEGLVHEINGFIESYREEHGASLKIMLSGGDALRLESYLKRRIFVEPQLALYGLMSLYELNHKK
jgi:type III pantothenate kinase